MSSTSAALRSEDAALSGFIQAAGNFSTQRDADFDMKLGIGRRHLLVKIRGGAVRSVDDYTALRPLTSWDFSLSADLESWQRFWEPVPAAGWHDIFALMRNGNMRIEGKLHPFMANLQLVKDLLAAPRSKSTA